MKLLRLQRILRLITILQSGRFYNPNELGDELEVSRRTIFRDLDTLRRAGIPYFHDERKSGYKISSHYLLPPLNLDLQEALALLLLLTKKTDSSYALPIKQEIQRATLKIENSLPAYIQQHCGTVLKNISVRSTSSSFLNDGHMCFNALQNSIRKSVKVRIKYESLYEKQLITTTLSPYHLHFSNRSWYVIGHSSLHCEQRTFKLERIKEIETLDKQFRQEKPFRIDKYLGLAWSIIPEGKIYNVKLCFEQKVARNVAEVLWHPTQKLSWHDDGKLTFEVQVDGLNEISWWILGYGDQVEVVIPNQLRRNIKKVAQNMTDIYIEPKT